MMQVGGAALFPGAGFFELAAASQRSAFAADPYNPAAVTEATISAPFRLPAAHQPGVVLCCELSPATGSCTATSRGGGTDDSHATVHMASTCRQTAQLCGVGGISPAHTAERLARPQVVDTVSLLNGWRETISPQVFAEVLQPSNERGDGYRVHPAALDSALQLGQLCLNPAEGPEGDTQISQFVAAKQAHGRQLEQLMSVVHQQR